MWKTGQAIPKSLKFLVVGSDGLIKSAHRLSGIARRHADALDSSCSVLQQDGESELHTGQKVKDVGGIAWPCLPTWHGPQTQSIDRADTPLGDQTKTRLMETLLDLEWVQATDEFKAIPGIKQWLRMKNIMGARQAWWHAAKRHEIMATLIHEPLDTWIGHLCRLQRVKAAESSFKEGPMESNFQEGLLVRVEQKPEKHPGADLGRLVVQQVRGKKV